MSNRHRDEKPAVSGPSAIAVRRTGLYTVLAACIAQIVVAHGSVESFVLGWVTFLLYLTLCAEPLRRVVRTAHVTWGTAISYLVTALAAVGYIFTVPVDDFRAGSSGTAALATLFGNQDLSPDAAATFSAVSWICFGVGLVGALTLWGQVSRLARRSEWKAIDHDAGDGALSTGATLAEPLGTSVTRPAATRPGRRDRS